MTGFDENQHPRGQAGNPGQFRTKENSTPAGPLGDQPSIEDPFVIDYPTSRAEVFSRATTFAEVDATWKARRADVAGDFSDETDLRWAALNRGRELRRTAGVEAVATALPTTGRDDNGFAHAQNDAELFELFDLATEELHGDGMASRAMQNHWWNKHREQARARRAELLAAGVVAGPDPIDES